jgi:hypothetical protein
MGFKEGARVGEPTVVDKEVRPKLRWRDAVGGDAVVEDYPRG